MKFRHTNSGLPRPVLLLGLALIMLMAVQFAHAAPVTAKLDRSSAVVGETVTLILQTSDTNQSLETDLSVLQADFDVLNQRSETQMSFVNGRQTASVRVVITLEPKREGNLLIPANAFWPQNITNGISSENGLKSCLLRLGEKGPMFTH